MMYELYIRRQMASYIPPVYKQGIRNLPLFLLIWPDVMRLA